MTESTAAQSTSIKETVISIFIAFALAFVFRGFVIEGFAIPTGSMAPTLLGEHMLFRGPQSGYEWTVGPRDNGRDGNPSRMQGTASNPLVAEDPMSGEALTKVNVPIRGGDSIFVLKYLEGLYDPERFDVVVFKNPRDPTANYIKRLIGLPGEQVALVDGDVFARPTVAGDESQPNPWMLDGWKIARKPERAQRAMWQPLFRSDYVPLEGSRDGRTFFKNPWRAVGDGSWQAGERGVFVATGPATLAWDTTLTPIDDSYPYNEPMRANQSLPVGDMRVSFAVQPGASGPVSGAALVTAVVSARGHEFRAAISDRTITLSLRPQSVPGGGENMAAWKDLGSGTLAKALEAGAVTNFEFWHADQALQVWVEGKLAASGNYEWTVAERTQNTFNRSPVEIAESPYDNLLTYPQETRPVGVRIEVAGPVTLYRVGLDRDIHFRAAVFSGDENGIRHRFYDTPATATHPKRTLTLTDEEFFCCGDNSPASLDGRLWDAPNPWVAAIDPNMGVVHRRLMIGKAFYVYFPAASRKFRQIPVRPDFGRMRWIW